MQRPSRVVEVFAIRSEDDLERALAAIDGLLDAETPSDTDRDRLEVLTALVEAYEDKHHPIPLPGAIDAIRFRLDQLGFQTAAAQSKALVPVLGSRSRVHEILHGKRALSPQMVARLWRKFEIPLESLVRGMAVRTRPRPARRAVAGRRKKAPRRSAGGRRR